jgi:hypothetical protein
MTRDEFAKWAQHHKAIFPDFAAWWEKLKADSRASAAAISEQWQVIFERINLADAVEASNRMLAGTAELCPAWERSMLASRIAAIAREIAGARDKPSEYERGERHKPAGSPAGQLYAEILRRIDAGEDPHAASEAVIPQVTPDPHGRKFTCRRCWDSGLVHVWHNISVRTVLRGEELTPANRRTMVAACSCHAADAMCLSESQSKPKNWHGWRQSARYAPESYCLCQGADVDHPQRIAELREWVADYPAKRRQVPEHMREKTFDDWNAA